MASLCSLSIALGFTLPLITLATKPYPNVKLSIQKRLDPIWYGHVSVNIVCERILDVLFLISLERALLGS